MRLTYDNRKGEAVSQTTTRVIGLLFGSMVIPPDWDERASK